MLHAWSDVAGGQLQSIGHGLGVVIPDILGWTYVPWPTWLNNGGINSDGVVFKSKLTCLEMLAALAATCIIGQVGMSRTLVVHVDNIGAVDIYKSGKGKSLYASILAKAIYDVGHGLGMEVHKIL